MQRRLIALGALFFFWGGGGNGPILYPFLKALHLPCAYVAPLPEEAQSLLTTAYISAHPGTGFGHWNDSKCDASRGLRKTLTHCCSPFTWPWLWEHGQMSFMIRGDHGPERSYLRDASHLRHNYGPLIPPNHSPILATHTYEWSQTAAKLSPGQLNPTGSWTK